MEGPNLQRLLELKHHELSMLQQVSMSVERVKEMLEQMVTRFESLNEGTEAVREIVSNWDDVKRVISMATLSLANYSEEDYDDSAKLPLTEGAVRVLIEDSGSGDEEAEEDEEEGQIQRQSSDKELLEVTEES